MSVADKQVLIKNIKNDLISKLSCDDLFMVMEVVANNLSVCSVNIDEIKNDDSADLLNAFISSKQIEGCSLKTLEHYRYVLEKMYEKINIPIRNISVYHIRNYLAGLKSRGISDRTLNGYRSVMCSFFGWLFRENLIPTDPCINLSRIKYAKLERLPFDSVEIEKLKEGCTNIRDKALVCFLISTGCRIGEVTKLNKSDVDFQNLEVRVLGKGNKERTVYIDDITAMYLKQYFESRTDDNEALFSGIGKRSERLTQHGVRFMLTKLSEKVGVVNIHPHRFRRTLATNLIKRGMSIQDVAYILGHDKIDTTMKYVYIEKNNVKNAYYRYCS